MTSGSATENHPSISPLSESVPRAISKLGSLGRSGLLKILNFIEWFLTAIWLLFLYAAALWLVLGTLTSFHFQTQISAIGSREQVLTVIEDEKTKAFLERMITNRSRELSRANFTARRLDRDIRNLKNRKEGLVKEHYNVEQLEEKIKQVDSEITQKQLVKERAVKNITRIESSIESYQDEQKEIAATQAVYSDRVNEQKIRGLARDFIYMRDWEFDILVLMPSHLLTLILTISMGALGSVIHLTWEFFDTSKRKKLTWYIFRPFLGGILAFAIFILIKSGQMFVTTAPPSGGTAEDLNPFFISFLAIISGMLSEQAYARISAAGSRVLAPPIREVERFIRGKVLSQLLADQKKEIGELVRYVQVPRPRIESWFAEKEPLSERHQELLAAWLGVSMRDLFTDQPAEIAEETRKTEEDREDLPETS